MEFEIKEHIGIFHNVFSKKECEDIIQFYENRNAAGECFSRQQENANTPKLEKDDYTFKVTGVAENCFKQLPFFDTLNRKMNHCYSLYTEKYDMLRYMAKHRICNTIRIQKTSVGGGYHTWHCENTSIQNSHRIAAWTLYLNDVEDGGETEFLYQHMRVKSKAGAVSIFPSSFTHVHRGNPPLSNDKYIITSWIEFIE